MAQFSNTVRFQKNGNGRLDVIINDTNFGHLRFFRINGELIAIDEYYIEHIKLNAVEERVLANVAMDHFKSLISDETIEVMYGTGRVATVLVFEDTNRALVKQGLRAITGLQVREYSRA
jgi:hypothetical protein